MMQRGAHRDTLGMIDPQRIDNLFVALVRVASFALIGLSVIGSVYGLFGQPLPVPQTLVDDVTTRTTDVAYGVAVQIILAIVQYGARLRLKLTGNRVWLLVYVWALAPSVWFNYYTYGVAMIARGMHTALTWCIIIAADVAPELFLVRVTSMNTQRSNNAARNDAEPARNDAEPQRSRKGA